MKKILVIAIAALGIVSCNMDFYSSDTMSSSTLKDNPNSVVYTTDGLYALMKDNLAYKGQTSGEDGNYYDRHYFQLAELRGDNVTISGASSDPFTLAYKYSEDNTKKNIYYTWWIAYKIISTANANIDGLPEGNSDSTDHMLGENYFFRAMAHFHMVTLFAKPYVCGAGNPGVVLRIGIDATETKRATVGEVYDQVIKDLEKAIQLMDGKKPRGNKSYVSVDAARALLSRVYLYMEDNDECIKVCNTMLGTNPASKLISGDQLEAYPTHTYDSPETIWCVRRNNISVTTGGDNPGTASIGSMYNKVDGQGWGEHYWSEELIELFQRYPEDKRFNAYFRYASPADNGKKMVTFPVRDKETNDYCISGHIHNLSIDPNDNSYHFKYNGKDYVAAPKIVGGYTRYYIDGIDFTTGKTGADKSTPAYIREDVTNNKDGVRNSYVAYFNTKFSGQDGDAMLTSPVFFRWAEVILNRAEAYAKTGETTKALDDVNIIRARAGIPEMTEANMAERGYTDVLDVVLDERRMELCFEGHRMFDVYRNRRSLDRRYVGFHKWEVIPYTDNRIALQIPQDEINTSGITQNPR